MTGHSTTLRSRVAVAAQVLLLAHGAAALATVPTTGSRAQLHRRTAAQSRGAVQPVAVASPPRESSFRTSLAAIVPSGDAIVHRPDLFPYKENMWIENLLSIPKSMVLRRISGHVLFNILVAAAIFQLRATGILTAVFPAAGHSLAGAFLGLLVTFRTNSAYARFWEARILWGGIMNTCRNLAVGARTWIKPRKPLQARRFAEALHRFPQAMGRQCRLETTTEPTDVCLQMQTQLHEAALATSWNGPMGLYELQLAEQARHVDKLVDATGAINRIIKTPLPLSYSRHTSRFLTVWCTTLPFALGGCGFLPTLGVVMMVSWLVLGIDSIGQLLEQPFSQSKDNGDAFDYGLPVEVLASGVAAEVKRIEQLDEIYFPTPAIDNGSYSNFAV